jgi:hypothetical protein
MYLGRSFILKNRIFGREGYAELNCIRPSLCWLFLRHAITFIWGSLVDCWDRIEKNRAYEIY